MHKSFSSLCQRQTMPLARVSTCSSWISKRVLIVCCLLISVCCLSISAPFVFLITPVTAFQSTKVFKSFWSCTVIIFSQFWQPPFIQTQPATVCAPMKGCSVSGACWVYQWYFNHLIQYGWIPKFHRPPHVSKQDAPGGFTAAHPCSAHLILSVNVE